MLNTILFEYNCKANNANINFDAYVEPGCTLDYIQDIDLVTMLGNLLDNAVLAATKEKDEAFVQVRIFMQKNGRLCVIKIVNNFSGELKKNRGKLLSTKETEGIHGVGITSVSKIAEKYGGYLETYVEDLKFNAILIFPC